MKKTVGIFKTTVAKARQHHRETLLVASVVTLLFIVYRNDFQILLNEAIQGETYSYILLVPFLAGFLFYSRRRVAKASLEIERHQKQRGPKYLDELIGLSLCLIGFLLYWYGSYTFYPLEYHLFSLPILVAGVILVLSNTRALLAFLLPILFLFFIVPIPSTLVYWAGGAAANFNTQAAYAILTSFGTPVALNSSFGTPTITLQTAGQPVFAIDLPCSGVYSLIAFIMMGIFVSFATLSSKPAKLGLFILGIPLFMLLNIFRIATTVAIAASFGVEAAMVLFHSVGGLLFIFAGMIIVLVLAEKLFKIRLATSDLKLKQQCPKCSISTKKLESFCSDCGLYLGSVGTTISRNLWTKILLLLVGFSVVVFSINAPTFVLAQGPVAVTSNPNWQNSTAILPPIQNYNMTYLYRDWNYENISGQDASLWYGYIPSPNSTHPVIYVDINVANTMSDLHNWEVCLITWQTAQGHYPLVQVLDSRDISLLSDPPLIARCLVFIRPENDTQVTLYWYEKASFNTGVSIEQKYVRISLIILTNNSTSQEYERLESVLLSVGRQVAEYWEPLKTNSIVSLGVPAQQLLLAFSVAFVAFTKTGEYFNSQRKLINNRKIFEKYATDEEKTLLQTVMSISKTHKNMETKQIADTFNAASTKRMSSEKLRETLERLQEYGFLRRNLIARGSQPRVTWKIVY